MKLKLRRRYKCKDYTIGSLYVDGKYFCDTLEDCDRGLTSTMLSGTILRLKKAGKTAIPTGTYTVDMNTVSPKFKGRKWAKANDGRVPRLLNVKGFSGVLIHVGNTADDTDGCILVGENKAKGKVLNSTETYLKLFEMLDNSKDTTTITIE